MCFSTIWLENLLIWLVVFSAIIAILRLVVQPFLVPLLGAMGPLIIQILRIVIGVIVAIAVIMLVFDLLRCVMPLSGFR